MSSAELARNQGLSPKYLEALLGRLRASGLVIATRGPSGGYQLARPPMDISVRDLYDVLEGGGYVACTDDATVCERAATCVTRELWSSMYDASMAVLEAVSLGDLVTRQGMQQDPVDAKASLRCSRGDCTEADEAAMLRNA